MKNFLIAGFLLLAVAVVGCSSPSGSGTGSGEEKLVQISPEEWQLISETEQYCNTLDYFGLTNEEATDRIADCQKDQLSHSLWEKFQKYMSVEQQQLRSEIGREEREAERQITLQREQQIQELRTKFDEQYKKDFQDCVINICKGNEQCFQCRHFVEPYTLKKIGGDTSEVCGYVSDIETCNSVKEKSLEQLAMVRNPQGVYQSLE